VLIRGKEINLDMELTAQREDSIPSAISVGWVA